MDDCVEHPWASRILRWVCRSFMTIRHTRTITEFSTQFPRAQCRYSDVASSRCCAKPCPERAGRSPDRQEPVRSSPSYLHVPDPLPSKNLSSSHFDTSPCIGISFVSISACQEQFMQVTQVQGSQWRVRARVRHAARADRASHLDSGSNVPIRPLEIFAS